MILPPRASGQRALALGSAYVLAYLVATLLFPRPESPTTRILLCALALAPPAGFALLASARRTRRAQGAERVLWAFVCAACALHALSVALFFARGLRPPHSALVEGLGLFAHHGAFLLLAVGLLARPDRTREARDVRASAHEDLVLAVCGAFLVAYFVILPPRATVWPSFVLLAVEDLTPALLAVVLARRVAPPDNAPYRRLAAGLFIAALFAVPGSWLYAHGSYQHFGPLDVAWMIPYWAIVSAATATGVPWLAAAEPPRERSHRPVAAGAVLIPPLVDLVALASGLPGDAHARSLLALAAFAVLALLAGLRLRSAARSRVRSLPLPAVGGSSDLLRLATGAAHELNNPLMAVAVASELAIARGGPEPPLRALQEAVHAAAAAIRRFQLAASGQAPGREAR